MQTAQRGPPLVAVFAGGERLILIDGYRRIAALRRFGRDTARVECWSCDRAAGVLGVTARTQSRPFAAIEEALLVRELVPGLGLSQHEVARRCGRDVSWVSRRLQQLFSAGLGPGAHKPSKPWRAEMPTG